MADAKTSSIFTLYSIGYVTVNKERKSRKLQCLPVESATATDGETTHNPVESILKGTDKDGNVFEVKGTQSRDIECEWLPNEDNRATPPDMRRGELVEIYRVGNTNQYYWSCMGFKNNLRTREHVVWLFGASPEEGGSGLSFDKCYSLIFSPLDGYISIKTTKANGEPFAYTFQINTKNGICGWQDDVGNFIELNSKESRIKLRNVDNSFLSIEKQWIDMNADKYIKFTVGGTTMELTPEAISTNTTTTNITSSGETNLKSSTLNINATSVKATVGRWDFI